MIDFAENLPLFLAYIVPGFLFITVYQSVLFKDKDVADKTSYLLIKSVVSSFVIKTIYDLFVAMLPEGFASHDSLWYFIFLFILAVVLGYLAALFLASDMFVAARKKLHIFRTIHSNIWDDVRVPGVWLRVWRKNSDNSYLGQIKYMDDYSTEPIVVLEYYQYLDENGDPLVDYSDNKNRTVMLNLSEFERVEIIDSGDCESR